MRAVAAMQLLPRGIFHDGRIVEMQQFLSGSRWLSDVDDGIGIVQKEKTLRANPEDWIVRLEDGSLAVCRDADLLKVYPELQT